MAEGEAPPRLARLTVLRGTLDPAAPLAALRGNALVWSRVFADVDADFVRRRLSRAPGAAALLLERTAWRLLPPGGGDGRMDRWDLCKAPPRMRFPPPTPGGLDVNMMPFHLYRTEASLPPHLHQYIPMIRACYARPSCCWHAPLGSEAHPVMDHVAYLTVHESEAVPAGATQRRAGLHVERPGRGVAGAGGRVVGKGAGEEYRSLAWGLGNWLDDHPVDGIFLASSAAGTTAVWPVLVERPEEVCDAHGGLPELARPLLGEPLVLGAGELCWITDRTPHEARPDPAAAAAGGAAPRQFFRLVVGRVSAWYARHSTPNPTGVLPDAPVSHDDKFGPSG